jgi:Hydroxymethylglutaryl-coenzyme A synthase C terminal
VASAAELPRQTGNMYTASLWAGLASLISELGDELLACQVTVCLDVVQYLAMESVTSCC